MTLEQIKAEIAAKSEQLNKIREEVQALVAKLEELDNSMDYAIDSLTDAVNYLTPEPAETK
jgi:hypothetical protein